MFQDQLAIRVENLPQRCPTVPSRFLLRHAVPVRCNFQMLHSGRKCREDNL